MQCTLKLHSVDIQLCCLTSHANKQTVAPLQQLHIAYTRHLVMLTRPVGCLECMEGHAEGFQLIQFLCTVHWYVPIGEPMKWALQQ